MRGRPLVWYLSAHYDNPGGIEVYLLHYATEMGKRGFDTRIVVFEPLPAVEHRCLRLLRERGIPIESLSRGMKGPARLLATLLWLPWRMRRYLVSGFPPQADPPSANMSQVSGLGRALSKRLVLSALRRRLKRERPDIIHVKGRIMAEAWNELPAERAIVHIATEGRRDSSWDDPEAAAFRSFAGRCARVFVPGRGVGRALQRDFGIVRSPDAVFTMAPDECGRAKVEDGGRKPEVRFGFLGRLHEEKGLRELLEALEMLRRDGVAVPFLFAGTGPMEGEIRAFAGNARRDAIRVEPVETPARSLEQMDVVVLPSYSEAMPLVLVEGLMCGRPCIATAVGGTTDLIRDTVEGLLIPVPVKSPDIVAAMRRFAGLSVGELAEFGRRARLRYEECCRPETVCAIVERHYRSIIASEP